MDTYLETMYRLWAELRAKNVPHLRRLAAIPVPAIGPQELLGEEHYQLLRRDYDAILARQRLAPDLPDRYERLWMDLDALFAAYYARVLERHGF